MEILPVDVLPNTLAVQMPTQTQRSPGATKPCNARRSVVTISSPGAVIHLKLPPCTLRLNSQTFRDGRSRHRTRHIYLQARRPWYSQSLPITLSQLRLWWRRPRPTPPPPLPFGRSRLDLTQHHTLRRRGIARSTPPEFHPIHPTIILIFAEPVTASETDEEATQLATMA